MSSEGGHEVHSEDVVDPTGMNNEDETSWTDDLRLVLVGKTGSGKSASGNTILGRRQFVSQISASSVTKTCELESTEVSEEEEEEACSVSLKRKLGKMSRVQVVDMPGFGDTHLSREQIYTEIAKCVTLSAPGPHAFLLVVPVGRYTETENQAAEELVKIFGEDALAHHTIVLFTRGDDLENVGIETYLNDTAPERLKALIDRCGGRYHVFNNRDPSNRVQVKELLVKVQRMQKYKGLYTNSLFVKAEDAIREEEEKILKGRGQPEGDDQQGNVMREETIRAKRQKYDVECKSAVRRFDVLQRLRQDSREEEKTCRGTTGTEVRRRGALRFLRDQCRDQRHSLSASIAQLRKEAALSPVVLERIKILVAAGATGLAVGAMFGAAAPLSAAVGASLMGNSVGLVAGPLAGISTAGGAGVGKAVGAIVAAASGKTAVAIGAATGGLMGGSVGAVAGAEAASPQEGASDALRQVGVLGVTAVGVAAGVGGALGAGAALGVALEAGSTAAIGTSASAVGAGAGLANASVTQAGLGTVQLALPQSAAAIAQDMAVGSPALMAGAGVLAEPSVSAISSRAVDICSTVSVATRILNAVADLSKAAAGIALAGGLVVKVVKEKVKGGTGTGDTEKSSYEVYWNSRH